jgi:GDP-L-fucose synthase
MRNDAKIYVAGHRGMVGSAILRALQEEGCTNIATRDRSTLDLARQSSVREFFESERPEYVFLAAAKVGGINANSTYPAEFIYQNLAIETNVIDSAYRAGVKRLLFLGSSCIYPRECPQPMKEDDLLTGPLETTNEPYAIAKIAGIKLCQSYNRQYGTRNLAAMPTNLYGPHDSFDLMNSHVIPALIRKFHDGRISRKPTVTLWGTGAPRREFLHVDDLANACSFLMRLDDEWYNGLVATGTTPIINVGAGWDLTVSELAGCIAKIVGYQGQVAWDHSMPDGTPRKLLDSSRMTALGWQARVGMEEGLRATYEWFLNNQLPSRAVRAVSRADVL